MQRLLLMGGIVAVQVGMLALMGRDFGCGCGGAWPWQHTPDPAHNSRHFTDPYAFLHLGFGVMVFVILNAMRPHWPRRDLLLLVVVSSAIWEVVENLPMVIALFGYEPGDPLAYDGDRILNSLGDTTFALAGGAIASRLSLPLSVALVVLIEAMVSLTIHDGYIIALLRAIGLV